MRALKFHGDAVGPGCIIDKADDGTPLLNLVGWE
jgi:hypothetical protein